MAKASVHVKRHLTHRERSTIAAALLLLAKMPACVELDELRVTITTDGSFMSDEDMRALAYEVLSARKVKVCRSKQREL